MEDAARWCRAKRVLGVAAILVGPVGCIADIKEERGYGASHPAPGAASESSQERRTAPVAVQATSSGPTLEVRVTEPTECRDVVTTRDMVHEVDVRRSFVNPTAQQWDLALALLLGGAAGLVAYDGSAPSPFSSGSHGGDVANAAGVAEWPLIAVAAVPMVLVAVNAARVQDTRLIEATTPETSPGTWSECGARPLAREDVTVSIDGRELHGTTAADGIARVDLSPVMPGAVGSTAIVHHAGSDDVAVTIEGIPSAR